ncbi:RNA polymerase sigma factor [Chitinivibrio alkaliphilus]|uniref:RNA polymerase sigma factor n=1 Tax=Chitinivibrio alkaliphilus ACht1 TaxID=1313304 RepID=U7DCV7_9BACT|nr:sigma-70 family RNA polymerase sigma factor [Chitinivibrio alkaliphilus]ERP39403.1 RNA polymerase, sigma subunit [Chitinivibrio alkaliphilus ACht1]
MKNENFTEKEYVADWLDNKNVKAFTKLYDEYKHKVFSLILRMVKDRNVAEDLLQDTFISALNSIDRFERNRSFLSWLFGIAHKKTIDYIRHEKVVNKYQDEASQAVGSRIQDPLSSTADGRVRELVNHVLEDISVEQKEVFLMREMGGVPFKDIAEITGCTINTALGRMRLACEKIRKEFVKRGYYEV